MYTDILDQTMDSKPAEKHFRHGLDQFNARAFFEAHETWEAIWLAAAEPDKTFLQGIIQVAAGFHHYQRGNRTGTRSLLEAGLQKLEAFPDGYRRLQLSKLRAALREWVQALAAGSCLTVEELPRLEWSDQDAAPPAR